MGFNLITNNFDFEKCDPFLTDFNLSLHPTPFVKDRWEKNTPSS